MDDVSQIINIEAEEAILGGILLDPEAMTRIADTLVKDAFSLQAHQIIYQAAQTLHVQGKPTDLMAVSNYLSDRDLLDKIGGIAKLAQLLNRTVSAVNIDRYNALVMEKYARRQLVKAGHEIVDLGYETAKELEVVLDESEQKIFRLTQERPQQGLVAISETLINAFNTIEDLHQETVLPGIPSGFYDLDGITSGFGRSDLIIIAGRPAMGKCLAANSELVCADGSIATIEEIYHRRTASLLTLQDNCKFAWTKPSAFIDDGIKPVFRMTTRLGRSIETTLTHPFLTVQGWKSLGQLEVGDKIAVPRKIAVFGHQEISEEEVRLLAGKINKQIPEIIFRLKSYLVKLFLSYLLTRDGWLKVTDNKKLQFNYDTSYEKLARQVQHLLLRFGIIAKVEQCSEPIQEDCYIFWRLTISDLESLKNLLDEISITNKRETIIRLKQIIANNNNQVNSDLIPQELLNKIKLSSKDLSREQLFELGLSLNNIELQNLATSDIYWDEIVTIESVGNKQVYDLTIPETHNFVANDICVHNTSFALNIAANIARQQNLPAAIFSLEMSREQLAQRMLASEAKIPSNRLRSGRISQNEFEPLINAVTNLSELPIFIDDTANLSVMQMRSQVRRLQGQTKQELGLVLLDYLQLMEGSGSENRVQELSKITRSLKQLAREINAPIIALSQLSRGVEQRTNKRPMLSDLRESGSIEQDSDLVMMLYRDEYYNPDTPDRGIAEAIIVKHRNGPVGTVKLLFKGELTKFENLAKPGEY
ncbi:MAG: replicative DNA helicase [Xenococcus sp. (in: cyanobacteria)]